MATVSFVKGESPSGDKYRVILAPVGSEGELCAISTTVYSAKRQSKFTNENSKRKYIKCIQSAASQTQHIARKTNDNTKYAKYTCR